MPQIWGEGFSNSCCLSKERDHWNSCSSLLRRETFFLAAVIRPLCLVFLWRGTFFFFLFPIKQNVCGNCRGRATPAPCCVTQNPTRVCPSLHVSSTANHEMQIDDGVLLFDCLRSGFHLMLAVTKLSMFDQVGNLKKMSLLDFSPRLSTPPSPSLLISPPQSICIMSICQTASVCSN